ncbi:endonuclease domain-containing protein [Paenarthrobacter sp. NPDC092416]|uniref:endonuclease domain-containing protein n=1 Tax=Paenarthrobacter sp. NPDC092416 TaxID=3364386 RepID=UPI0038016382
MKKPTPLPTDVDPQGFLVADAYASGVPRWRLQTSELVTPSRGIRLARANEHDLELLGRLHTAVTPRCAVSHVTAALLWSIPLPIYLEAEGASGMIHVTRRQEIGRVKRRGVIGHRAPLLARDVRVLNGVHLTSPEWTWVDLARQMGRGSLVAAGDALLARDNPLSSIDAIQEVIDRRPKVKGIRMAREILPLLRAGVDSPQESRLRVKIVDAGLPEPAVTQPIFDDHGRYMSTPDLQYKEYKIAMEYEGDHHRSDPVQWGRDIERDDRLRAKGWIVLRFSDVQMKGGWVNAERKLRDALTSRGWRRPSS